MWSPPARPVAHRQGAPRGGAHVGAPLQGCRSPLGMGSTLQDHRPPLGMGSFAGTCRPARSLRVSAPLRFNPSLRLPRLAWGPSLKMITGLAARAQRAIILLCVPLARWRIFFLSRPRLSAWHGVHRSERADRLDLFASLLPHSSAGHGSFAPFFPSRPTSAGMLHECSFLSAGRARGRSAIEGFIHD